MTDTTPDALPIGVTLLNQYRIDQVLGQGGFGLTYLAHDIRLNIPVALKEFFAQGMSVRAGELTVRAKSTIHQEAFQYGLTRFLDEARNLARFRHPNIVQVLNFFEEHGSAYMVMTYEEGYAMSNALKLKRTLPEDNLLKIVLPLLDGLKVLHSAGFTHRDIKPDNIYIRNQDGSPVLLDFGSARQTTGDHTKSLTTMLTPGYAPFEQYYTSSKKQGPWTDIYSMAAVLYRSVTGRLPVNATDRSSALLQHEPDPLPSAVSLGKGRYSESFLVAIDKGLTLLEKQRPQNIDAWLEMLIRDSDPEEYLLTQMAYPIEPDTMVPTEPPQSFSLTLQAQPETTISFKNHHEPYTPGMLLPPGIYAIEANKPGFKSVEQIIEITDAEVSTPIKLEALTFSLSITTEPPDAIIEFLQYDKPYVRGIQLPSGDYKLKISKNSYDSLEEDVAIVLSDVELTITLAKTAFKLHIEPHPADAVINLLNTSQLYHPNLKLPPGNYKFEVTKKKYKPSLQEIEIIDTDISVDVSLKQSLSFSKFATTSIAITFLIFAMLSLVDWYGEYQQRQPIPLADKNPQLLEKIVNDSSHMGILHEPVTGTDFVWVPAGCFQMGSAKSTLERRHNVCLSTGFWMAQHEITQGQWQKIMGHNPAALQLSANHPVEQVSWHDVHKFIQRLNNQSGYTLRLPTEAEWEYACSSGGHNDEFCGGNKIESLAWHHPSKHTSPIKQKHANYLGLYDMSGNVWEWVEDDYDPAYYMNSPTTDPPGPITSLYKVMRGGSYKDDALDSRAASRSFNATATRHNTIGARLVIAPIVKNKLTPIAGENSTLHILTVRPNVRKYSVFVDGKDLSQSRLEINLPPGKHTLKVTSAGYVSFTKVVNLIANQAVQVNLVKNPPHAKIVAPANWTDPITGMEFIWVPKSCFQMGNKHGNDEEQPVHRICLSQGFWMAKYEITQGQWQKVTNHNPSENTKSDNHPVENISWKDVQLYIAHLNKQSQVSFRLPTEAEWEYACTSGGRHETYCGGNNLNQLAWHRSNANNELHAVGGKQANSLGLYDMSGNVTEWVQDAYNTTYYNNSPNRDPTGPETAAYRVNRGGSWGSQAEFCRSTNRHGLEPGFHNSHLGARLVRNP